MAIYELGDVTELLSTIKKDEYKFINYLDLSNSSSLKYKKIAGKFPSRAKWVLRKNSILIGRVRPNNRNAVFINNAPINGCASSGFSGFVGKDNLAYTKYVWLLLNKDNFWDYCVDKSKGGTYPEVSQASILAWKVDIPELSVQKKIIDIIEPILDSIKKQNDYINAIITYLSKIKSYIENKGLEFIKITGEELEFKTLLKEVSNITEEDNALPLYSVGTKGISLKDNNDITYKTSGHKAFTLNELICGLGVEEIHWNEEFPSGCISNAYSVYKPLKSNMSFYKYFLIPQLKKQKNLFTQNTNRRAEAIQKKRFKELKHLYYSNGDLSSYSNVIKKCDELIALLSKEIQTLDDIKTSVLHILIK